MSRLSSVVRPFAIAAIICTTVAIASPLSRLSSVVSLSPSHETDQLACFAANPDIAGIGVRVSTYAQSLLPLFTTLLCLTDGYLDLPERRMLEKSSTNLLITACALLISALIEAVARRLSIYHALLVLNWSWMLTTSALLLSVLPTIDGQTETSWSAWMQSAFPSLTSQILTMSFVSLHMSLMGAFGVYVWWHPDKLGGPTTEASPDSVLCLQRTLTYIVFHPVRASSPKLRILSIACYFVVALPFVNVILLTAATVVIINMVHALICKPYTFGRLYRIAWIVQTAINVVIAANTELSIMKNKNLITSGESTWGIGQVLAVLLIFSPLLDTFSVIKDKLRESSLGKASYWFQRFLRKSEDSWEWVYLRESRVIQYLITQLRSLDNEIDPHALRAILGALQSARDLFEATNMILESSSSPRPGTPDFGHGQQLPLVVFSVNQVGSADGNQANPPGQPAEPSTDTTTGDGTPALQHLLDGALAHENQLWQTPETMADTPAPVCHPPQLVVSIAVKSRLKMVKRELVDLWERMSITCEVRFPVPSPESFHAAKAYLRATEEALGVAIVGLKPLT